MDHYATNRLVLEKVKEIHADGLLPIWQNYNVTKFTMIKNINRKEDCIERINRQLSWGEENAIGPFVVKENDKIIGYCGGRKNADTDMEIFYHIDESRWGLGLGTEIAEALIEIAFSKNNVNSVKAEAVIGNIPSWKILEKIGMKRVGIEEGVFENKEGRHDFYVYTLEKTK